MDGKRILRGDRMKAKGTTSAGFLGESSSG